MRRDSRAEASCNCVRSSSASAISSVKFKLRSMGLVWSAGLPLLAGPFGWGTGMVLLWGLEEMTGVAEQVAQRKSSDQAVEEPNMRMDNLPRSQILFGTNPSGNPQPPGTSRRRFHKRSIPNLSINAADSHKTMTIQEKLKF